MKSDGATFGRLQDEWPIADDRDLAVGRCARKLLRSIGYFARVAYFAPLRESLIGLANCSLLTVYHLLGGGLDQHHE